MLAGQQHCQLVEIGAAYSATARPRVVERTFSWFGRNRRLAKDFENLAETLGAFVALASIQLALRRLARM
jgi:putative transposase